MTEPYVELHCHSHYSLLDASSSPEALLDRALALGMGSLALTDHDALYGAVEFWRGARKRGLQPIIGAELTLAHGSHLVLLAETQRGYANLSRLISIGQLAGHKGAPLLTIEDITHHAEGLLCLTGCSQGAVAAAVLAEDEKRAARAAGMLADIFGRSRVWIELQRHWLAHDRQLNAGLAAVARATNLPLVATNNVHYARPEDHRLRDVLLATKHLCSLTELAGRPGSHNSTEFYLKGPAEMAALFADFPEALTATQAIAERCRVSLDFSDQRTPAFPPQSADFPAGIPQGETAFSYLYALCQQGVRERFTPVTPTVVRQLAHELVIIEATGLADYFLIVWDIVRYAQEQAIRCQGRGSAAGSLVAYALGITPVDPLRHNLLFERFLSADRNTMPDIDIDFAADRRDEIVAYVFSRYGVEHAAMVCNVVTYQWRLAVRDVARSLGFMPEDVDRISATLRAPSRTLYDTSVARVPDSPGSLAHDDTRGHGQPWENLRHLDEHALRLVVDLAHCLIDTPRHLSVHSGGILIAANPLVEIVPVERATKGGIVVTQWNKDSVEDAGLIKIDLLCLRTLDLVSEAETLITQREGQKPPLNALSLDDPAVYRALSEGDTIGAFQVESRAQAQMLPRLKPRRFEDIIVQVAIIRPGPIQGGMIHPYLRRRRGEEAPSYLHPALEPVLGETLGVILFQEQVIRVAVALAGFTPGEADLLRRAMSRARSTSAMAQLRERFVAGAEANKVDRKTAEEMFRQLEGFAIYGFCKSHAAAFALVSYQTQWLKLYYPLEFYCALLNHQPMGFYSPEVVVGDAQRHGVRVLRPDVNLSRDECAIQDASLRLGLRYLHGLGEAGSQRLLGARGEKPFTNLTDFCRRTRLPRGLIGDLIRAGAFGSLSEDRRGQLWTLGGLQYEEEALIDAPGDAVELPVLDEREAMTWDYELLGLTPSDHPMRIARPRLKAKGYLSSADLVQQPAGRIVVVGGLVVVRQAPPTAKGHLFISLEDEFGLINLIIRPDMYRKQRELLQGATFLAARGVMQRDGGSISVLVREARLLKAF
jgi:error-prone DNA polymerase